MSNDMWKKHVQEMKEAILSDNNIKSFFEEFEPKEDEGFCWTQDPQYKRFASILDSKTGRIHSGTSFAICLRCALFIIEEQGVQRFQEDQGDQRDQEVIVVIGEHVSEDEEITEIPLIQEIQ